MQTCDGTLDHRLAAFKVQKNGTGDPAVGNYSYDGYAGELPLFEAFFAIKNC